jgi:hypothetical protein
MQFNWNTQEHPSQIRQCYYRIIGGPFVGYVMRRVYEQVEVLIVVNPCNEEELGDLYLVLRKFKPDVNSFEFEAKNYNEVDRLDRVFTFIRQGQEPENFSYEIQQVNYGVYSCIQVQAQPVRNMFILIYICNIFIHR